jgi:hypothetical protein
MGDKVPDTQSNIDIFVATKRNGSPVYENVLVEPLGPNTYRLLRSPGLALGIAADDVFEVTPDRRFHVLRRGMNLCVQILNGSGVQDMLETSVAVFNGIGGRLDGQSPKELVFTIHVSVGFSRTEKACVEIVSKFSGARWYYGNVYDPADGVTPLNWW